MRDLPAGTVTLLFTDIEGSTRLLRTLGSGGYADALAEHRRILREAFGRHQGAEVDTQGDAFFVAFASARDAVAAAAQAQAALAGVPGCGWGCTRARRPSPTRASSVKMRLAILVSSPEFESGRAAGRSLSLDGAIEYALHAEGA